MVLLYTFIQFGHGIRDREFNQRRLCAGDASAFLPGRRSPQSTALMHRFDPLTVCLDDRLPTALSLHLMQLRLQKSALQAMKMPGLTAEEQYEVARHMLVTLRKIYSAV